MLLYYFWEETLRELDKNQPYDNYVKKNNNTYVTLTEHGWDIMLSSRHD